LNLLDKGLKHLKAHIKILKKFNIPIVVVINKFDRDTIDEINLVEGFCRSMGVRVSISEAYVKGGNGATKVAKEIIDAIETDSANFTPLYDYRLPIQTKIDLLAKNIYLADKVEYSSVAKRELEELSLSGFSNLPVCMAKTQFSISDDPTLKGVPDSWTLHIRHLKVANGAGFIVAIAGNIMLMPGLPKIPAAMDVKIDDNGNVTGLR
ncbi:MAG: formate--tetrahydrofolate ligase, partial [Cyanobacteriota bacterium]